jgi:hypothetical protein
MNSLTILILLLIISGCGVIDTDLTENDECVANFQCSKGLYCKSNSMLHEDKKFSGVCAVKDNKE